MILCVISSYFNEVKISTLMRYDHLETIENKLVSFCVFKWNAGSFKKLLYLNTGIISAATTTADGRQGGRPEPGLGQAGETGLIGAVGAGTLPNPSVVTAHSSRRFEE